MNACIGHLNGSYPLSKLSHLGLNRDVTNSTVSMSTTTVHWAITQKQLHEMCVTFWKVVQFQKLLQFRNTSLIKKELISLGICLLDVHRKLLFFEKMLCSVCCPFAVLT